MNYIHCSNCYLLPGSRIENNEEPSHIFSSFVFIDELSCSQSTLELRTLAGSSAIACNSSNVIKALMASNSTSTLHSGHSGRAFPLLNARTSAAAAAAGRHSPEKPSKISMASRNPNISPSKSPALSALCFVAAVACD